MNISVHGIMCRVETEGQLILLLGAFAALEMLANRKAA